MVAALLFVALSLPARSGVWPKAEEKPPLLQAQGLLQGKLDGDAKATLLELSILNRCLFVGMFVLSDGTSAFDRTEVVRQHKVDLGLGMALKTLKDVAQEAAALASKLMPPLNAFSMEPEHRATVPSAADFEDSGRFIVEAMAPWEACRRGGSADG